MKKKTKKNKKNKTKKNKKKKKKEGQILYLFEKQEWGANQKGALLKDYIVSSYTIFLFQTKLASFNEGYGVQWNAEDEKYSRFCNLLAIKSWKAIKGEKHSRF